MLTVYIISANVLGINNSYFQNYSKAPRVCVSIKLVDNVSSEMQALVLQATLYDKYHYKNDILYHYLCVFCLVCAAILLHCVQPQTFHYRLLILN